MKIKSTFILALCGFMLFSGAVKAQAERPNVLKLNIFALAAKNFSFQYERAITKKSSLALGLAFMPSTGLPSRLASSSDVAKAATIEGFGFTPEYRWYPASENGAPNGFYLAPYLRYAKYSLNSVIVFQDSASNKTFTHPFQVNYGGFGLGVMIGAQWLIKEKFSIDWWILGGHGGSGTADIKVLGDFSVLPTDARNDLKKQLDEIATSIPVGKATGVITNTSAGIEWEGPFSGLRTGLTLGWAF